MEGGKEKVRSLVIQHQPIFPPSVLGERERGKGKGRGKEGEKGTMFIKIKHQSGRVSSR